MQKILPLIAVAITIAAVIILFLIEVINLNEFATQFAVGLTLLIPLPLAYALKPEIHKWNESRKKKQIVVMTERSGNGIKHYTSRSELTFDEMISQASQTVEISALTFTIITLGKVANLETSLSKGIHITFLLNNIITSKRQTTSQFFHASDDIKDQIQKSLGQLCKLKAKYKDQITIRLCDAVPQYNITIIDRNDPKRAWIRVEYRIQGRDSDSRPTEAVYKIFDEGFFRQYLEEYDKLLKNSEPYECGST